MAINEKVYLRETLRRKIVKLLESRRREASPEDFRFIWNDNYATLSEGKNANNKCTPVDTPMA